MSCTSNFIFSEDIKGKEYVGGGEWGGGKGKENHRKKKRNGNYEKGKKKRERNMQDRAKEKQRHKIDEMRFSIPSHQSWLHNWNLKIGFLL